MIRLENEHNPPPPTPAVLEKRNRALKLKKRRDRKRRIADADGGRMDGDMRLVDEEIVQSGARTVSRVDSPQLVVDIREGEKMEI